MTTCKITKLYSKQAKVIYIYISESILSHFCLIMCSGYHPWDNFFIYHFDEVKMGYNAILLKWHICENINKFNLYVFICEYIAIKGWGLVTNACNNCTNVAMYDNPFFLCVVKYM